MAKSRLFLFRSVQIRKDMDSRTGLVDGSKQAVLPNANQRSPQKKKKPARQSGYNEMKMISALRLSSLEE